MSMNLRLDFMARITHFDMAADNPTELFPFYEKVFGWKFEKWSGGFDYWFIKTGPESEPGIDGGLGRSGGEDPTGTVNVIDVDDIDTALRDLAAAGGTVIRPKGPIPGVGWFALFSDPQGLRFGLMQADESVGT